jgi:DHA1 family bicyclomycin/chloramphenicol resistance-like MFS transporter
VAEAAGWRAVFWVIGALAVLAVAMVAALLPETRPPAARAQSSLRGAMAGYGVLLRDRHFLAVAFMASLTLSGFFVYVANSSFVMSTHFGVSPRLYAVLFALNAVSMIVASQFNARLAARFGIRRVLRTAVAVHAGVAAVLLVVYGLNGVIVPSAFVVAMEGHAARAGTASALLGTLNFAGGAVVVALVSPFADGTPLPMVVGIAGCSFAVLVLALRGWGRAQAAGPVNV